MSKALVVYDSFFGNTERIAQSISDALGRPQDIGIVWVVDVKPEQLSGLKLLIVGSPTRAFSPSPAIILKKVYPETALKASR